MAIAVVAGNPKPESRTLNAARLVARRLTGADPDVVIDVVKLGAGLLGLGDPTVATAVTPARAPTRFDISRFIILCLSFQELLR